MPMLQGIQPRPFAMLFLVALSGACSMAANASNTPVGSNASTAVVAALPAGIAGPTWEWVSLTTPAETLAAAAPGQYTIAFSADGTVAVQADCNRGHGSYSAGPGTGLSLGPIGLTKMACPGDSHGNRFVSALGEVDLYSIENGDLVLRLSGGGEMRFSAQ